MQPRMDTMKDEIEAADIEFGLGGKGRSIRTMSAVEFDKLAAGQGGATLDEVVHHGESKYGAYGLIDDTFLAALSVDHNKIQELIAKLGETRDEVSIVARTADGGFTRMLLKKFPNGKYEEVKEDVESKDKTKTHRQENDLFIFEKGVKTMAA